jgi:tetratricopeptide (TPR) repeat protein
LQQSLNEVEKMATSNSLALVPLLNSIAYVYGRKGDVDSSAKFYNRSIEILRHFYGEHSIKQLTMMNYLAYYCYQRNKRYQEAENTYKQALDIAEKNGVGSLEWSNQSKYLGDFYLARKNWTDAEGYYKNLRQGYQSIYGSEHIAFCKPLRRLAYLYRLWGKCPESEELLNQGLKILEKNNVGKTHREYKYIWEGLKYLYKDWGKEDKEKEAETKLKELKTISGG